jgi:hypothetical protein
MHGNISQNSSQNEKCFRKKVVRETENSNLCSITYSRKLYRLWDNVERHGTARQATDDNTSRRMCIICSMTEVTDTHSKYIIITDLRCNNGYAEKPQCYVIHMHSNSLVRCVYCPFTWVCWERECFKTLNTILYMRKSNSKTDTIDRKPINLEMSVKCWEKATKFAEFTNRSHVTGEINYTKGDITTYSEFYVC